MQKTESVGQIQWSNGAPTVSTVFRVTAILFQVSKFNQVLWGKRDCCRGADVVLHALGPAARK